MFLIRQENNHSNMSEPAVLIHWIQGERRSYFLLATPTCKLLLCALFLPPSPLCQQTDSLRNALNQHEITHLFFTTATESTLNKVIISPVLNKNPPAFQMDV